MSYQNLLDNLDEQKFGPDIVTESRQNRLIEGIIDGKTATQSAMDAGFSPSQQRTPWKLIPADELRSRFQAIAERKGLTLDRIGNKLLEHLDARANQTLNGKEVTQSDAPDYKIQQKAIDQFSRLMGMDDATKAAQAGSSISVTVTGAAAERLMAAFEGRE